MGEHNHNAASTGFWRSEGGRDRERVGNRRVSYFLLQTVREFMEKYQKTLEWQEPVFEELALPLGPIAPYLLNLPLT